MTMIDATARAATPTEPRPPALSGRMERVSQACHELAAEGQVITFGAVAGLARIGRNTLFRHRDLQALVQEHISRQPPFVVSLAASEAAMRSQPPIEPTPLRLLVDQWLTGRCERSEIEGSSARVMATRLESLLSSFGDRPVDELDRGALLQWQASIGRASVSTRRMYMSTINQFCRWLVIEGHLKDDPTTALARVREPRRVARNLRRAEVTGALTACPDSRWRTIVLLMVSCGLRCVEISNLELADYNPDGHTILVRGKGGSERVLPVPTEALAPLHAYLEQRGWRAGPLFVAEGSKSSPDGRISAYWVSRKVGRIMAQAGVHKPRDGRSAHSLRHTAASDVMDTCKNVRTVQQMLGHTSLQTTQIYLRNATIDELRAAMNGRRYNIEP